MAFFRCTYTGSDYAVVIRSSQSRFFVMVIVLSALCFSMFEYIREIRYFALIK